MAILKELSKYISKGKFVQAGDLLYRLSYEDFVDTLLDNNFRWSVKFAAYFWQTYIPQHKFFKRLFSEKYAVTFLKLYLKNDACQNKQLLVSISEINPTALVNAFRLTQAFLNDPQFESISFFKNSRKNVLQRHYKAFEVLRKREYELFIKAKSSKFVSELNLVQWLFIIFIHYELRKREKKKVKEPVFEHEVDNYILIQTYNVFLSYLVKNQSPEFGAKFQPRDIIRECNRLLVKGEFLEKIWHYIEILKDWRVWYLFVDDQLDTYCYDLNYDVAVAPDGIKFFPIDPYLKAQRIASSIATRIFHSKMDDDAMFHAPGIIPDDFLENIDKHLIEPGGWEKIVGMSMSSYYFTKAYILSFYYGLDVGDIKKLSLLLRILSGSMAIANVDYGNTIQNITTQNNLQWLLELLKSTLDFDPKHFPIEMFKALSWHNKCVEILGLDFLDEGIHLIPLFDTNEPVGEFDRFNPFINLWQKPFLKFGDTVCYIKTLLSDMDPAIVTLETYLNRPKKNRDTEAKTETAEQEKRFANIFKNNGFSGVFSQLEFIDSIKPTKTIGEIDILIHEDNELLIIEMKRSKLQLTPKEQRCEQYEVIEHATEQLQKIIKYIKANPDCLLEKCNITPDQVKSSNISGCVLNMYHHLDGTKLAENIYKTSFVSMFHNIKQCSDSSDNKVTAFINNTMQHFIDPKVMKFKDGQFDFVVSNN